MLSLQQKNDAQNLRSVHSFKRGGGCPGEAMCGICSKNFPNLQDLWNLISEIKNAGFDRRKNFANLGEICGISGIRFLETEDEELIHEYRRN